MKACNLEEKLKTHNRARAHTTVAAAWAPTASEVQDQPKDESSEEEEQQEECPWTAPRGQPTLVEMLQRLYTAREDVQGAS